MKRLPSQLMLISALAGLIVAEQAIASPSTGPPSDSAGVTPKEKSIAAQFPPLELVEIDWVHCEDSEVKAEPPFTLTILRYDEAAPMPDFAHRGLWGSWCLTRSPSSAVLFNLKGGAGSVPATIV